MFDIILFDLDGTVTDPKVGITTCVQQALERSGYPEPDITKLEAFIGPPLKQQFADYTGMSEEEAVRAVGYYRERYSTIGLFENEEYPGMKEMLAKLKRAGRALAIATSKPRVFAEQIIRHFNMEGYFDLVMGSELDGTRGDKAEVIEAVIKELSINAGRLSNTIMVGDRKHDIIGAREHGLGCIGVTYGYGGYTELKENKAAYIVDTVKELESLLIDGCKSPALQ